jgi:hypothetical protein
VLATGPKGRGFKSGQDDGFLRAIKLRSTPFGWEIKPECPWRKSLRHVKHALTYLRYWYAKFSLVRPFLVLAPRYISAGSIARELWWTSQEFSPIGIFVPWLSTFTFTREMSYRHVGVQSSDTCQPIDMIKKRKWTVSRSLLLDTNLLNVTRVIKIGLHVKCSSSQALTILPSPDMQLTLARFTTYFMCADSWQNYIYCSPSNTTIFYYTKLLFYRCIMVLYVKEYIHLHEWHVFECVLE